MNSELSSFPWLANHVLSTARISTDFQLQHAEQSVMNGSGQHQTLSLQWNIAYGNRTPPPLNMDNKGDVEWSLAWFDVLLVFRLPEGVFFDSYELQHRFPFTWPLVNLYSYQDYIPYEDISFWHSNTDMKDTLVAVELLQMPCKRSQRAQNSPQHPHCYCSLQHTLQLPIHLQYYQAQSKGGFVSQNMSFPHIYLRPRAIAKEGLPNSSFYHTHRTSSRQVEHFYEKTLLGQVGNLQGQESYFTEVSMPYSIPQTVLRIPVGNLDHHVYVTAMNAAISTLATLLVMYFILKHW